MVGFFGAVSNTTRNFLRRAFIRFYLRTSFCLVFRSDLPKRKKYQWEIDEEIEMSTKQDQEITVNYEYKKNNLFVFLLQNWMKTTFVTIIKYELEYSINYCKKTSTLLLKFLKPKKGGSKVKTR